jgi:FlaA1/EpsC-like NDP-sugar epimerase/8-oxo-dGTP pyrophosphatase MutT (NUDIX family)
MKSIIQIAQRLGVEQVIALSRQTKQKLLLAADILFSAIAWTLVSPRLDGESFIQGFTFVIIVIGVGSYLGLYRAVLRFAGVRVLWVISLSYILASLSAAFWQLLDGKLLTFAGYLNLVVFGVALAAGTRILLREALFQSVRQQKTSVVLYGAGDAGRQLLTAITQSQSMRAVAMVDDDKALEGAEFHGVRVYPPSALSELCNQNQVRTVILAVPNLSRSRRAQILQELEALSVRVRSMPRITDILTGRREVLDLEEISVEELLGRDAVEPLRPVMRQAVSKRVVCVTGAGGSIGSELLRQLLKLAPRKLVLVELSEFALYEALAAIEAEAKRSDVELVPVLQSITDSNSLTALLDKHQVQLLFHAAAYKHVPLVELNPFSGLFNNVFGTQAVLDAAIDARVEAVVLISTDKAVRPTNVMGASKRIAELIAQAYAARQSTSVAKGPVISMVRFGNVLSSSGSVIPRFQAQIREGGPVTVTHPEITRYFMTISEAVELVIQTAGMSKAGDVFLLDMGKPVKILDLAVRMIKLSGLIPVLPTSLMSSRSFDFLRSVTQADPIKVHSVPIVFTGLRPGEKLYEELLIDAAAEKTDHPMIRRASERFIAWEILEPMLDDLRSACEQRDERALKAMLEKLDIGYHRQFDSDLVSPELDVRRVDPQQSKTIDTPVEAHRPVAALLTNGGAFAPTSEPEVGGEGSIHPVLSKSLHLFFLLTRPLTLGARGIVLNDERQVLLVRHRYDQGWQLPGGGVEIGESAVEALRREVLEEAGVIILSEPRLLGAYHNRDVSDRDHVLVYRCDKSSQESEDSLSAEIAESGFFSIDNLPESTTPGTRRRLAECFDDVPVQTHW